MLDARVDIGDVKRGLRGLAQAGQDIGPLLQEARKPLRTDQREHQKRRRGPDGPWPGPSAASSFTRGRHEAATPESHAEHADTALRERRFQ